MYLPYWKCNLSHVLSTVRTALSLILSHILCTMYYTVSHSHYLPYFCTNNQVISHLIYITENNFLNIHVYASNIPYRQPTSSIFTHPNYLTDSLTLSCIQHVHTILNIFNYLPLLTIKSFHTFYLLYFEHSVTTHLSISGADPGILVRGGAWIFFSKAWGLGAAWRPPMGPTMGPPMGKAPGSSWILVILWVKI